MAELGFGRFAGEISLFPPSNELNWAKKTAPRHRPRRQMEQGRSGLHASGSNDDSHKKVNISEDAGRPGGAERPEKCLKIEEWPCGLNKIFARILVFKF